MVRGKYRTPAHCRKVHGRPTTVHQGEYQSSSHAIEMDKYNIIQYITVQYRAVQCSAIQYSTVQYSTVQCSTAQYNTIQHYMSLSVCLSQIHVYIHVHVYHVSMSDWFAIRPRTAHKMQRS